MSEAYEIGVTLALSDGVSTGIERARKDMAALELALTAGSLSIHQLRSAGLRAMAPQLPPEASARPSPGSIVARSETDIFVPVSKPRADPSGAELAPAVRQAGQITGHLPTIINAPIRQVAESSPAAPAGESRPARHEPIREAEISAGNAPRVSARPTDADTRPIGPVALRADLRAGAPSAPVYTAQAPAAPLEAPPVDKGASFPSAAQPASASTRFVNQGAMAPTHNIEKYPIVLGRVAAPFAAAEPPTEGDQAPTSFLGTIFSSASPPEPRVGASGDGNARQMDAASAPSVPPASPAAQMPAQGDVFLDGMLVGRWISKFLVQEAGRALAGPTGFDARRSRLLPGATVGG